MSEFLNKDIDQCVEEAFSLSTAMDVSELRILYYGRLGIFISFNSDGKLKKESDDTSMFPAGIVCHTVADVVGRKVKTNEFYASVFRVAKENNGRKFLEDIREYDNKMLERDLQKIAELDYISDDAKQFYIRKTMAESKLRNPFSRLWNLTKNIAETKGEYAHKFWRKIFMDLGYLGFNDTSGSGYFIKRKVPAAIVFDYNALEQFDIVPIQKRNRERRNRIINQVERDVQRMTTARNRVAKKKFKTRSADDKGFFEKIADFIGGN